MKKKMNPTISDYVVVFLGCAIQAFAVTSILRPNNLVVGGFTGVSLVIGQLIHVQYTYIYYLLCLSVLVAAYLILGKKEALNIVLLSTTYPLILILFDKLNFRFIDIQNADKLLCCIYYGIIEGIGVGLVLRKGFSQGSSDTLAKILHKKFFQFISMSQILLAIDICILTASALLFGRHAVLYAIIMQAIYSKTIDTVLFGFGSSLVKMVIISDEVEEISSFIMNNLNKGVSISSVKGGYSNKHQGKVICICSKRESMITKNFVAKVDKGAFMNLVPVISAWGQGNGFENLDDD